MASDISFKLLVEELEGIECVCCKVDSLPLADLVADEDLRLAEFCAQEPCTEDFKDEVWGTPFSTTAYFTPTSAAIYTNYAREERSGQLMEDQVAKEAAAAIEGIFTASPPEDCWKDSSSQGPEALEAWLTQRRTELARTHGDGPEGIGRSSSESLQARAEIENLRQEVAQLKIQLMHEKQVKQKIMNSRAVLNDCEAIF